MNSPRTKAVAYWRTNKQRPDLYGSGTVGPAGVDKVLNPWAQRLGRNMGFIGQYPAQYQQGKIGNAYF